MQGNSNRPIENSRSAEDLNRQEFQTYNYAHSTPVTAQPQQFSRSFTQMLNYDERNSRCCGKPLINCTAAYGQNNIPWLKMSRSDQSTRLNSSDSVIINFDNINEPSTSHLVDLHGVYINKAFTERFQQNIPLIESVRLNEPQNLSNNIRETNLDIEDHMRNYNSHYHNGCNINSAATIVVTPTAAATTTNSSSSNNNNNNNNNNSNNTSVIQNNEGHHAEDPNSGNQFLEKIFYRYIPFITFLLLKAIYDHREGILIFVGLLVTFIHANSVVKREIAKQSRRSLISLGIIFVNLFVSICFIYFVFRDQHLYKNLIFIPSYFQPISVWDVLWIVGITDFVLKFITIQIKVGMACFPAKLLPYSARVRTSGLWGKWYLLLERTSQLYRGLVPIQPWWYYLMEVYQGPFTVVGMFFSVAYVLSKGSDIMSKVKLFLKAFFKLLQSASLGVRPSSEQLVNAGSQCPICHDEYSSPIMLQCRHVFCESCVSTWFDREQTCPLCRAKIADDPSWRDGATSLFTQLF